jgi:hypothetical protein
VHRNERRVGGLPLPSVRATFSSVGPEDRVIASQCHGHSRGGLEAKFASLWVKV